jgi:hypothetical protein
MNRATLARKSEAARAAPAKTAANVSSNALRIGEANDAFEQEADRVADAIMAGSSGGPLWSLSRMSIDAPLQRECDCGGSGKCSACREGKALQRKPAGPAREGHAPSIVHEVLSSPGRPLDRSTRNFFEPRFGHDFGHVRIHTDARAVESAHAVDALAYTVGRNIVIDSERVPDTEKSRRLLAHELVHTVQQQRSPSIALRRQAHDPPEFKLVDDFGAKFPAAAKLIKPNPAAMKLVKEAFDAGAKFGGYTEDGPDKGSGRAYTVGDTVYVPKTRAAIPVQAMSDFLFELNNAIRGPKYAALAATAAAGKKTDRVAAKKYAHDTIEGEVEGMLRLGDIWFETKAKYLGKKAHEFDQYDRNFYLSEYKSFKDRKKTKNDIINDVLQRKYDTGTLKGKTTEQAYIEQYEGLAQ